MPTNMVWLGLPGVPAGLNRTKVVLVALLPVAVVKLETWLNVAPALVLSQSPLASVPRKIMLLSLGSTAICSPLPRPLELPPTWKDKLVCDQVSPALVE